MREWLPFKAEYIMEALRLEAQTPEARTGVCLGCEEEGRPQSGWGEPVYRCKECFGGDNICLACCLGRHLRSPLHIIEVRGN